MTWWQALISKTKGERKTKALQILLLSLLGIAEEIPNYCWVLPSHWKHQKNRS